jgi:hypothetical protein
VIVPMKLARDGVALRADAICAVKSGRAMLLVALGTEEQAKARAGELRELLRGARFATDETKAAGMADFTVKAPKSWKAKEVRQEGSTQLGLSPKGVKEDEFFAGIASVKTAFASMKERKARDWLRAQVKGALPGLEKRGDMERLEVDGAPAVGLT